MPKVLIIDDNEGVQTALSVLFGLHHLDVLTADSPESGLEILEHEEVQLVVQDMNFTGDTTSGAEGEALFSEIRSLFPDMPIILLTAWTHLDAAVRLVREGAADYLGKPWDDDKLLVTVNNLLQRRIAEESRDELVRDGMRNRTALEEHDLCGLIFESNSMVNLVKMAIQVSRADVPVLITGANGAGKEKIAEIIHANSGRDGELIKVNAGALPADLIESELFGSVAGAFTGSTNRIGRFEAADGGTLFLDEIGTLSMQGQQKLLRVLQTGEFEKLGSSKTTRVDVRLITATNSNLAEAIASKQFREDLFYRINLIEIKVPSLNERSDDILPLAEHFLQGANLSSESKEQLLAYHWPGNVRELENSIKRAILLSAEEPISPDHLGLQLSAFVRAAGQEPNEVDIRKALAAYNGIVARAAKSLGLSRQALYRRMEKYGLK